MRSDILKWFLVPCFIIALSADAMGNEPGRSEVILYEHANFLGVAESYGLRIGQPYSFFQLAWLEGKVSSVKVGAGVKMVPFRDWGMFNEESAYAESFVKDYNCPALHYRHDDSGCQPITTFDSSRATLEPDFPNDAMRSFLLLPKQTKLSDIPGVEMINRKAKPFLKRADEMGGDSRFFTERDMDETDEERDRLHGQRVPCHTVDSRLPEIDGLRLSGNVRVILYPKGCNDSDFYSFPEDTSPRRHFDLDAMGMDTWKAFRIVLTGPEPPGYAPPPVAKAAQVSAIAPVANKGGAIVSGQAVAVAPGPVIVAQPSPTAVIAGAAVRAKSTPEAGQKTDAILGIRRVDRNGANLKITIAYRVSSTHGSTVYIGAWPYIEERAVGGYLPTSLPATGEGEVTVSVNLNDPDIRPTEIEVFLSEPGKAPFISRRLPLN